MKCVWITGLVVAAHWALLVSAQTGGSGNSTSNSSTPALPNTGYAPSYVPCPPQLSIRQNVTALSPEEQAWRTKRAPNVLGALKSYLPRANISGFDVDGYLTKLSNQSAPVIALAVSGGGSVSGLGGLGIWQAMDERYPPAVKAGTGGLGQCLTYLTGLSGGGYLTVSSIVSNNFDTVDEIRSNVNFDVDFDVGPNPNATTAYFTNIFENVAAKAEMGFSVSITDVFGQLLSEYLNPAWQVNKSYSDIATNISQFQNAMAPMPILVFTEVVPGQSPSYNGILFPILNTTNTTSYEMTPFEFGSWRGGRAQGFMPLKYIGTEMTNGSVANSSVCVSGFDKMSFAQGSTANAFNAWIIDTLSNGTEALFAKRDLKEVSNLHKRQALAGSNSSSPGENTADRSQIISLVDEFNGAFNETSQTSLWARYPNPFNNISPAMKNVSELYIVDGSEAGQTIPLWPVIQPQRNVDFIIAFDGSGDETYGWQNGTNLVDTANVAKKSGLAFPQVPDAATIVNLGLNQYPTFFGCEDPKVPLVLYFSNAPWSAYTNYSYRQSK